MPETYKEYRSWHEGVSSPATRDPKEAGRWYREARDLAVGPGAVELQERTITTSDWTTVERAEVPGPAES